jgi:sodium-dependent phosphate cotransporter
MSTEDEVKPMPSVSVDAEADAGENDSKDGKSRKERATGSTHFGDTDFYDENADEIGDATWGEVCKACCVHSPAEWGLVVIGLVGVFFFLYFFLLGLDLLGSGAKVLTGCTAGALFGDDTNPIAGLMIGILCTVLLQSSSTTTSIIVSLVGADILYVRPAIYMIMGANIGTSVTNTIVAMGQMGDGDQLERAFAGATVHDMFNFLTVGILLPVEAATGFLYYLTGAMVKNATVSDGSKWVGPVKVIVSPLSSLIIKANKNVIKDVAAGTMTCADYYPTYCAGAPENGGAVNYKTCANTKSYSDSRVGLITCDKSSGKCPLFFADGASAADDKASGGVTLVLGLIILIVCLIGLVSILQKMLMGVSTRVIYKATNINGYVGMVIGAGITVVVQSSSITTSVLTPLVGMGVIQLEQMFPLTLGANIGTTVTALMAAMVSDKIEALQVSLAHLFFNITGILIWYPIPFMRRVPLSMARTLGKGTRWWRGLPALYIAVCFFMLPIILLGISYLFTTGSAGFTALGAIIVIAIGLAIAYFVFWWNWREGKTQTKVCFRMRETRRKVNETLPEDMAWLMAKVNGLVEHTCMPEDEEEAEAKNLEEGAREECPPEDIVA